MNFNPQITKWVRPGILVWITLLFTFILIIDLDTKPVYLSILETVMMLTYTSYFVGRSAEKIVSINKTKKPYTPEPEEIDSDEPNPEEK